MSRRLTREPRRCVVCGANFTPTRDRQHACGFVCGRILSGRTLRAKGPAPALVRQQRINRQTRKRFIERTCLRRFGALTEREIDLFNFAVAEGYRRGYSRGYNHQKRGRVPQRGAA